MKKNLLFSLLAAFCFVLFSNFSCSNVDDEEFPSVESSENTSNDDTSEGGEKLPYVNMTEMCHSNGVLYGFLSQYDENWNSKITYYTYYTLTGEVKNSWITDGTQITSPYKVFTAGNYVCIAESDYVNDGYVNIFTAEGKLVSRFTTGVGPRRAVMSGEYLYILNEGLWGYNNATLTQYNITSGAVVKDCFSAKNNRGIGDTANDIVVCGDKMFIAVSTDEIIWVTDANAEIISKIELDAQPRFMTQFNDKVYVTLYDGRVARIDAATMSVEAMVNVGRNPEQLCVLNGKLFVANSGGLDYSTEVGCDKTVSVIDISTFTEIEKIVVVLNPANILAADDGFIYLVSLGNVYNSIPNTFQRIDPDTYEVKVLGN